MYICVTTAMEYMLHPQIVKAVDTLENIGSYTAYKYIWWKYRIISENMNEFQK